MATTLFIKDMTCGSCVAHVTRALRDVEGVERVEIRLRERRVEVEHSAEVGALIEALAEAGYQAST